MKNRLNYVLFLVFFFLSVGNNVNASSIDSAFIDSLNKRSFEISSFYSNQSLEYAKKAYYFAEKQNYRRGKIYALVNIAVVNRNQGNFSFSLEKLKTALEEAYFLKDNVAIATCLYNIGDLHKILGNYDNAVVYFTNAYTLFHTSNDYLHELMSVNNMAHSYMDKGFKLSDTTYFHKAIKLYLTTLHLAGVYKMENRRITAFINLANAYNVFGKQVNSEIYYSKSIAYSLLSFKHAKEMRNSSAVALSLNNIGEVLESKKNYDKAFAYFNRSLIEYEKLGEANRITDLCNEIARVLHIQGKTNEAILYSLKASESALKQNHKYALQASYSLLSDLYAAKKDYEKAFKYNKLEAQYKDSLLTEKNMMATARMQVEFDSERKDGEIVLLHKNKLLQQETINAFAYYRNVLIAGCIVLSMLLLVLAIRYREKQKTANQILKAKEEAEHAKEMQEQFLANTSHEIRTPMNGILGMATQLRETNLSPKQKEYLSAINESANDLLVIINDLLDISRMKAGKMIFTSVPFNLTEALKPIVFVFENRCREKGIGLELKTDEKIPVTVVGDRVRLIQILNNLVANAVKFTEKGMVSVLLELAGREENQISISFKVRDTGIGIPHEMLPRIFESFTQVDAKTTRKYGGTGLGLTICKQLVEQMGGKIHVSSKINHGSEFDFVLPFETINVSTSAVSENDQVLVSKNLEGARFLVVDDNKLNRQVARLTLEKWKAHVYTAESAKDAFRILSEHDNIAAIFMDITMPEMDGFEATNYIRTNFKGTYANIPIIAMTASAFTGDREKCLALGMSDYISKPFRPDELYIVIERNIRSVDEEKSVTDFTLLYEKADGDNSYLIDIMALYIEEMPGYVQELKAAIESGDRKAVRDQAHKMKSPVGLFGANELKSILQSIELIVLEQGVTVDVRKKAQKAFDLCMRSKTEVQLQLTKILVSENNKFN